MNLATARTNIRIWFSTPLAWVLIGGLLLRLYSAGMRTIINPDGAQYIYQASAIFNLHWSNLLTCKLTHLSPLPFFIAPVYIVFRDWIIAGQMVSVLFGWGTLLPLYFILRRFFHRNTSTLTTLIYALMPVFVDGSGNVIRGPMFWFSLCMGMHFFLRQWDDEPHAHHYKSDVLISAIFFLLCTWCRIEGVVFLVVPFVYLCLSRTDHKLNRCLIFVTPMTGIAVGLIGVALTAESDLYTALKVKQVIHEATQFVSSYHELESMIKSMDNQGSILLREFLHRSRESLGLIPLVVIFHNVLEGVFYPFALILFAGFIGIRQRCDQHHRMTYLLWQTLAGFLVLYIHTLQIWIVSYRFLAVLILPGCVLMANGVDRAIHYLHHRRQWSLAKAMGWIAVGLIVVGLPKSLKPEESDKAVYRQAAQVLVQQKRSGPSVSLAGFKRSRALEWIQLYAHRGNSGMPCSQGLDGIFTPDYRQFVANIDAAGIRYLLYEERYWPHDLLDIPSTPFQEDFRLLGRWQHPDSKKFMLLERLGP